MSPQLETRSPTRRFSDRSWIRNARVDAADSIDREFVIDASAVEQINSQDLSQLIRLQLDIRHDDKQVVLENVSEQVIQVIQLTRLDRLIEIRKPAHS